MRIYNRLEGDIPGRRKRRDSGNGETGLPTLTMTIATTVGGPLSEKWYSRVSQLYFSHHHTSGPQREVERDAETLLLPETT